MNRLLVGVGVVVGLGAAAVAPQALAGMGSALVASGGDIQIRFEGQVAGFDSAISVNGGAEFLPNHGTLAGTTVDLGDFSPGTMLDIVLHVFPTNNYFHSGAGSGNLDGLAHAKVTYDLTGGRTYVGFEDTFGGGDFDYDDLMFSLTNVQGAAAVLQVAQVPEPGTLALMGLGFVGLLTSWPRKRETATN